MCMVFFLIAGAGVSISQETEPEGRFGGEVDVTVVTLEVRVRDAQDRPVTGLTAADFQVLENGEAVAISNFYEVKPAAPEADETAPAEVAAPEVNEPGAGDISRLVLFIDDENINPNRRNKALDELAETLTSTITSPPLRVTILKSSRGLKWVLNDSDDPAEVRTALKSLYSGTGGAVFADADFRTLVRDLATAAGLTEARGLVRQYAQQRMNVARATFVALSAAMSTLSGEPGRLILLYVGNGFPVEPGSEAFKMLDERYPGNGVLTEISEYQLRPVLNDLVEQANAADVTFSAYDAQGLDVSASASTDGALGMGSVEGFELDRIRRTSRQAPLAALTDATGGAFSRTDNSIGDLLEVVADDLTTYYSIGFESRIGSEAGTREIKVSVDRPGLTVRHKSSFAPRSPAEQRADATLAVLFLEPQDNPLELGVRIHPAEKKGRRRYLLPIDLLIPLKNLVSLPSPDGPEIKLELLFASCDEHGTTPPVQRVEVTGPRPQPQGDKLPLLTHRITLQLEPGDHRIAVTAHDLIGGATSSVSGTVSVP